MNKLITLIFIISPFFLFAQQGIIFDDGDAIKRIEHDGSNYTTIIESPDNFSEPTDVEIDTLIDQLFWSDEGKGQIIKSNLDGSNPVVIISNPTATIRGIALDESTQQIYWIEDKMIKFADYDGSNINIIINQSSIPNNTPHKHLEIDYSNDKIYWTEDYYINNTGTRSLKINRADIDGSNIQTLNTSNSSYNAIMGLDLDLKNEKVYFSEYYSYTSSGGIFGGSSTSTQHRVYVRVMNLDGTAFSTFKNFADYRYTSVFVDESKDEILFSRSNDQIIRYGLDGSLINTLSSNSFYIPRELFFDSRDQKIYYVDFYNLNRINEDDTGSEVLSVTDRINPRIIHYNEVTNWIYWLDQSEYLARVRPNGSEQEIVFKQGLKQDNTPLSFTINDVGNQIFWTEESAIYTMNLDGTGKIQLVNFPGLVYPRDIHIDSDSNRIYFMAYEAALYKIYSVKIDGTGFTELISDLGSTDNDGFTIHPQSGKMYWTDTVNDEIKQADFNGSNITSIYNVAANNVNVMTTSSDKLFWHIGSDLYYSKLDGSGVTLIPGISIASSGTQSLSVSEMTILPVELASFTGRQVKHENYLTWNTLSESNNYGFEIERSTDGEHWDFIGFVEGRGFSSNEVAYSFMDNRPLLGNNYYRLRQVDFDGAFEYSNIILIEFESGISVHLSPVPTKDMLTVTFPYLKTDVASVQVQVVDVLGRILIQENVEVVKDGLRFNFDVSDFPSGHYFVVAMMGKSQYQHTQQFIIAAD